MQLSISRDVRKATVSPQLATTFGFFNSTMASGPPYLQDKDSGMGDFDLVGNSSAAMGFEPSSSGNSYPGYQGEGSQAHFDPRRANSDFRNRKPSKFYSDYSGAQRQFQHQNGKQYRQPNRNWYKGRGDDGKREDSNVDAPKSSSRSSFYDQEGPSSATNGYKKGYGNRKERFPKDPNYAQEVSGTVDTQPSKPSERQNDFPIGRPFNKDYNAGGKKTNDRNGNLNEEFDKKEFDRFQDSPRERGPTKDRNNRAGNKFYGDYFEPENRGYRYPDKGDGFGGGGQDFGRNKRYGRDKNRYQGRDESMTYPDRYWGKHRNDDRHYNQYYDRYQENYEDGRKSYDQNGDYSRGFDPYFANQGFKPFKPSQSDYGRKYNHNLMDGQPSGHQSVNIQESFDGSLFQNNSGNDLRPHYNGHNGGGFRENHKSNYENPRFNKNFNRKGGYDASQRDRLVDQLSRGILECLVCCERVRQADAIWSCGNCFHVLHLNCVKKWAKSSERDAGWRCPACQNVTRDVPSEYRCFCGKILGPQWNRQDIPHSCGDVCEKSRPLCTHHCFILCHPGPCPPCTAQVERSCGCGKVMQTVKCGIENAFTCEGLCEKLLNCGVHFCAKNCHSDPCEPCPQKIEQVCYCGKHAREVDCTESTVDCINFCCEETCDKTIDCGNHKCEEKCHEGSCKPCQLIPDIVTHCPCGQTELSTDPEKKRKSCLDPIPTCDKICGRKLLCGQPSNHHSCKVVCHHGSCPPCQLKTPVRCRCGNMDRSIPCDQLTTRADDVRCEKKCTKKRSCGKHKCNQFCCIEIDHPCPLPCNHLLTCGKHRCEQLCHRGHCQQCWRTSFEELLCECGMEVLYPPIPCGTKPPPCSRPCTRQHECEHPALHNCHSDSACPPCTVLTHKWCYGKHELRKSIPCHQKEFSCGLPCNKPLPCGRHRCIQPCHKGDCIRENATCTQNCTIPRPICQHPCSAPCHSGPCPEIPCKEKVRVTCECGYRSAMKPCEEHTREFQRLATSYLASKMADIQLGNSVVVGDIMANPATRKLYQKSLECNDECKIVDRNRRVAIALQIRNPDLSSKLTPRYSDFLREWAKKDPQFCQMVHDKLTELVKLAKESKQKSRSYSFEVMNRQKRKFVQEYCEYFGCESCAYDEEPKRNVVATAQKEKAWLPSVGLVELVERDSGRRKVPGPVLLDSMKTSSSDPMNNLSNKWSTIRSGQSSKSGEGSGSSKSDSASVPSFENNECDSSSTSVIDHFYA